MRPQNLKTKIFLDSGDPAETREAIRLLGFLDGQTTNPSLVSRHPNAKSKLDRGERFTLEELLKFYREIVFEISELIPHGSVSIEVYADKSTSPETMFNQGNEMFSWIPNAHIKYPTTFEGLWTAQESLNRGMRVNMTLCFTQEQAAAVHCATIARAKKGEVFISPFVGRLDDKGINGMALVQNIVRMYRTIDSHTEVLTASVRSLNHLLCAVSMGSDIVTSPLKILKEWAETGLALPGYNFAYDAKNLAHIEYKNLGLGPNRPNVPWRKFNMEHELTLLGIDRFSADWNSLIIK